MCVICSTCADTEALSFAGFSASAIITDHVQRPGGFGGGMVVGTKAGRHCQVSCCLLLGKSFAHKERVMHQAQWCCLRISVPILKCLMQNAVQHCCTNTLYKLAIHTCCMKLVRYAVLHMTNSGQRTVCSCCIAHLGKVQASTGSDTGQSQARVAT